MRRARVIVLFAAVALALTVGAIVAFEWWLGGMSPADRAWWGLSP